MFEQAQERAVAGMTGSPSQETEGGESPTGSSGSELAPQKEPNLIDLDQIEKFKYKGEEWDRNKLEKSLLMHSDYTRKSQQLAETRKQFQQEQKFYDNLAIDIANVIKNPALVDQFKQIYPEKFHQYLKYYESQLARDEGKSNQAQQPMMDTRFLNRLEQVESRFQQQEIAAAESQLDGIFGKYQQKYPYADETLVTTKALALMEKLAADGENQVLTERQWDSLFKSEHERIKAAAESRYKTEAKEQIKSNRVAKDSASGGGTPGQAPVKRTFKQATEDAINDLKGARYK